MSICIRDIFISAKKVNSVKIYLIGIIILLWGSGCHRSLINSETIDQHLDDPSYDNFFAGLHVVDALSGNTLYGKNHQRNFTPASNTKIATLYTALKLLGDSIPACSYVISGDTIHLQGSGDPTFLHPYFRDSSVIKLTQNYNHVFIHQQDMQPDRYGPGWAWEDYDRYFSPERSTFPFYGNVVTINWSDSLQVTPEYFKNSITLSDTKSGRKEYENIFSYNYTQKDSTEIPFITSDSLLINIWNELLPGNIILSQSPITATDTLYSTATDSVLKRMMVVSDNFLAEQLLILAAFQSGLPLDPRASIRYMLNVPLQDLPQKPRWVDGSGLSRYNLISPQSITHILQKLYVEVNKEKLFSLFPKVYLSTTKHQNTPYAYAKSGSLGNNYNLSGYLITRKGRLLIFSFMNNHFIHPTSSIKNKIHQLLYHLWED